MCESCTEPIPSCSHGEILSVDLNTTNSCCPQYYCGVFLYLKKKKKNTQNKTTLRLFPFLSVCSKPKLQSFAVCDVNLCPESSVSCAAGLSLVQTHVPGLCCPQYHCGTHKQTLISKLPSFFQCFIILYNFVFVFFTVFVKYRMQVWGWLSLKLSSGKKAKINNTTH